MTISLVRDSEAERQIDVSVRWADGENRYLLIIDAKDWSRPADIGDVEKFAGLARDVRASKGILICNKGFSRQAHNYAKSLGVGLCNVHDAESRDWSRDLTVPIVWIDLTPQVRCHAEIWLDPGDQPQADEDFPFIFSFADDSSSDELRFPYSKIDALGTFVKAWNAGMLSRELDEEHEVDDEQPLRALAELLARLRALLRRSTFGRPGDPGGALNLAITSRRRLRLVHRAHQSKRP